MTSIEHRAHVLRVFTDADGCHGNPLGILRDADDIVESERQRIGAELIHAPAGPVACQAQEGSAWVIAQPDWAPGQTGQMRLSSVWAVQVETSSETEA